MTPDATKDGAKLDFRGVQAWDANTAIIMSSGPGDLSRLYKTTDGCKTWKLLFKNPDKAGFWDAMQFRERKEGWLLGDPVHGRFVLFYTTNGGKYWSNFTNKGLSADAKKQGAFAASNSSINTVSYSPLFVTGGRDGAAIYKHDVVKFCVDCDAEDELLALKRSPWVNHGLPLGSHTESSGAFSIDTRIGQNRSDSRYIAVGGDYTKPNDISGTAAWSSDGGATWTASAKPPHGYRSTVQWSEPLQAWFTAGTNGSDFSTDDGLTWQPLDDGNWNALSLPFLVGPEGRIARLNEAALKVRLKAANPQK